MVSGVKFQRLRNIGRSILLVPLIELGGAYLGFFLWSEFFGEAVFNQRLNVVHSDPRCETFDKVSATANCSQA